MPATSQTSTVFYEVVKAENGRIDILYVSAGAADFNVPLGSIDRGELR